MCLCVCVCVCLCVSVSLCVCVCLPPRLLITSGVMWCDIDPMQLVKQVLQLYMATLVIIVNGRVLGIGTHHTHSPHKS